MQDLKPRTQHITTLRTTGTLVATADVDLAFAGLYVHTNHRLGSVKCADCGVDIPYIYACLIGGTDNIYVHYHCYLARIGANNNASK
jgi:hypothetical protein